ncbi:MAG TPA: MerR family transcriptional regulator [Roseiflexaceae bacterium]|nr:MerR family transcriptional regulator [Roseiflexaceae bacterium]
MADETTYSISELAAAAGVTTRTIRYYAAEGLLPAPELRGKYAVYRAEHLERLRLIAQLKAAYLPLSAIKEQLDQLGPDQLREALIVPQRLAETSGSAAEYIANALTGRLPTPQAPGQSRLQAPGAPPLVPPAEAIAGADRSAEEAAAEEQIDRRIAAPLSLGRAELLPPPAPAAPPAPPVSPAPAPQQAAPAPASVRSRAGSLLSRLVPRRERPAPEAEQPEASAVGMAEEERWSRVVLAPGVELHIREPAPPALRERLARLIEQARNLLHQ